MSTREAMNEQLEKAKQEARQTIGKLLEKNMESMLEALEDAAEDALINAGFNPFPDDEEATNEYYEMLNDFSKKVIDDAVQYWHGSEVGPVYALLSFDGDNGLRGLEVEFFSGRPHTATGDPDNWPQWFRVYEGNLDGGDSIVADSRGANFG